MQTKLERSNPQNENPSKEPPKGKQQVHQQQSAVQSPRDSFLLPDLNLPPQDILPVHQQLIDRSNASATLLTE
jgi:hypothetical protein